MATVVPTPPTTPPTAPPPINIPNDFLRGLIPDATVTDADIRLSSAIIDNVAKGGRDSGMPGANGSLNPKVGDYGLRRANIMDGVIDRVRSGADTATLATEFDRANAPNLVGKSEMAGNFWDSTSRGLVDTIRQNFPG